MRKVITIPNETEQSDNKPIEFTHYQNSSKGWSKPSLTPNDFNKILYLGKCNEDGDMFSAYKDGIIRIYKGHLNSGTY